MQTDICFYWTLDITNTNKLQSGNTCDVSFDPPKINDSSWTICPNARSCRSVLLLSTSLPAQWLTHCGNPFFFFWNLCLSCCTFEEDNSYFPLLQDLLMNDALDSHLLDFPRFLCVALTQRVTQASCKAPKSILPFSFLQHDLVFVALSIPTRLHRNPCWMLSSSMSHLLHAMLAISVCDLTWWRSV